MHRFPRSRSPKTLGEATGMKYCQFFVDVETRDKRVRGPTDYSKDRHEIKWISGDEPAELATTGPEIIKGFSSKNGIYRASRLVSQRPRANAQHHFRSSDDSSSVYGNVYNDKTNYYIFCLSWGFFRALEPVYPGTVNQ